MNSYSTLLESSPSSGKGKSRRMEEGVVVLFSREANEKSQARSTRDNVVALPHCRVRLEEEPDKPVDY